MRNNLTQYNYKTTIISKFEKYFITHQTNYICSIYKKNLKIKKTHKFNMVNHFKSFHIDLYDIILN